MNVGQALASTGVVRFGNNGRIISVNGVVIAGNVDLVLRLNGRPIPQTLLYLPVHRGDSVGLELFVTGPRSNDPDAPAFPGQVENNFDELQRLEAEEAQ
ncbi:hypothetical protein [Paenibacillus glycinis]|uniref:Uncharacterized protein n=1 Tax=Paenibacillus glycinis TaxID=2697035 RepID=A0ABW9XXU6_9BACL|nr:hypothetical protein [Paenibacillus glycinis]NBD27548.1 hypothetical protein [Paenibacillus glycinis]